MNSRDLLSSILVEVGIIDKNNLEELSKFELEMILFKLLHETKINKNNMVILEKILNKLYSKIEANFYLDIVNCNTKDDIYNIINSYSKGAYNNEMFCRTGPKTFWKMEAEILRKKRVPFCKRCC